MSNIEIKNIIIPPRLRMVDEAQVAKIAKSIAESGLLQSILVRKVTKEYENETSSGVSTQFHLVDGAHRLTACKKLGHTTISYELAVLTDAQAILAEIDANLMRHELNAFDRAKFLAKRKVAWEAIYGKPASGGDTRSEQARQQLDMFGAWDAETRSLTGLSTRTIQREIAMYECLSDEIKDMIDGTWIAKNGATIKKIIEVGNVFGLEKQLQAVQAMIDDPSIGSPKKALGMLNSGGDEDAYKRDANDIAYSVLMTKYGEANREVKTRFIQEIIGTEFFNEIVNNSLPGRE